MIPRIVWALACLGLIGYWASIGQVVAFQNQMQYWADPQIPIHRSFFQSDFAYDFRGNQREFDQVVVSTQDLRDAIGGEERARDLLRQKINVENFYDRIGGFNGIFYSSVHLGWMKTEGVSVSNRWYSFGGSLWASDKFMFVYDVRDSSSVKDFPNFSSRADVSSLSLGSSQWFIYPKMGMRRVSQSGAKSETWTVDLVNVFGLLSLCVLCSWLICIICCFLRVAKVEKRYFGQIIMLFLVSGIAVYSLLNSNADSYTSYSSWGYLGRAPTNYSNEYSINQLNQALADDEKLIELCQKLLADIPVSHKGEMLLTELWLGEGDDTGVSDPVPETDYVSISIGHRWQLIGYQRLTYVDLIPEQIIPDRHFRSLWNDFVEHGMLTLQWGPIEDQRTARLGVIALASIGMLFTLIWKCAHSIARFALGRVQKRRVRRSACIYCAYPLTQAGLQARYPENNT